MKTEDMKINKNKRIEEIVKNVENVKSVDIEIIDVDPNRCIIRYEVEEWLTW